MQGLVKLKVNYCGSDNKNIQNSSIPVDLKLISLVLFLLFCYFCLGRQINVAFVLSSKSSLTCTCSNIFQNTVKIKKTET